jgi:ornithine cyclodeaminase
MRVISAADIDAACRDPGELADALAAAFAGAFVAPPRHHHVIPRPTADATALLMPAWTASGTEPAYLGCKFVTVYPDNAARSLPSVLGSYLLTDGASGLPLAVMDGTRITLHRTAAASALAARYLAPHDATRLLMVGAGALAPFMIRAHCRVRPSLTDIAIWNRSRQRAEALAAGLAGDAALAGRRIRVADDLAAELGRADVISAATMSREPLVLGARLKPGTHVDLVGAYNLSMREADDAALARAAVYVDTPAARTEGGDVAVALKAGTLAASAIRGDLAALVGGTVQGRRSPLDVTLFKSVGAAIEDLAAAALVWRHLAGS